jgi:hypothetical protein
METKEQLTAQITKRKAALAKQTAEGSKVTADHVRRTRRMLKRAQRRLTKLAKAAKSAKSGDASAAGAPAEAKTGG